MVKIADSNQAANSLLGPFGNLEKGISGIMIILITAIAAFILWEFAAQSAKLTETNRQIYEQKQALKNKPQSPPKDCSAPGDPCDLDNANDFTLRGGR